MILRLSGRLAGTIVIESVLIGSDVESLRPVGTLRLRPAEWQMLNAVIGLGADRMDGDITVVIDGPLDIASATE